MTDENIQVYKVVKKLIGPIKPVGKTQTDEERYENLLDMISVADCLLYDINDVARENKDRQEFSMKLAGKKADRFLKSIKEEY